MDVGKVMDRLPGYAVPEIEPRNREILLEALTTDAGRRLTICEQLRFIYDTVYQLPDGALKDDLVDKLVVAFDMGKKMNTRLAHYKRLSRGGTGRTGRNLLYLTHTDERREIRRNRG